MENNLKVSLVSGLMGESIYADCYINGKYYDFIKKGQSYLVEGELGQLGMFTEKQCQFIESELRRQYERQQ